jgi:hypothetical protein
LKLYYNPTLTVVGLLLINTKGNNGNLGLLYMGAVKYSLIENMFY